MDRMQADRGSQALRIVAALRGKRPVARAKVVRRGQAIGAEAIVSFGMVFTLLAIWAMAVHL